MTIPIKPGPFSFLETLGRAGGEAFRQAEISRQTRLSEARQAAQNIIALRNMGLISPQDFELPEIKAVFQAAGIGPVSSAPTSGELAERTKRDFMQPDTPAFNLPLSSIIPGAQDVDVQASGPSTISDERRLAAGLPTRSQVTEERVKTGKLGRQEKVLAGGTEQQKDALAGVPDALTLQTQTEGARDQLYNSLALRSVDAQITRAGGDIMQVAASQGGVQQLAQSAWEIAQLDAKSKGYTAIEELTRPYIEAAIAARIREAQNLEAKKLAATARGGDTPADYLRLLQQQQAMVRQQLSALPKPSQDMVLRAQIYQSRLDKATTPEERQKLEADPSLSLFRQAHDAVQSYNETVRALNNELNGYRDALQNPLGQVIPNVPGATPGRETRQLSEQQVDAVVQRMRQQNIPPSQVDQDVQAGLITAADGAAIKQRLNAGAAAQTKPRGAGGRF